MRKTKIKRIVTAVLASALMVSTAALFAGCGSTDTGTSGGGSTAESSLSGKLTLNGSTSMATVCQALGEVFHEQNPGVTVEKRPKKEMVIDAAFEIARNGGMEQVMVKTIFIEEYVQTILYHLYADTSSNLNS